MCGSVERWDSDGCVLWEDRMMREKCGEIKEDKGEFVRR